jgi:hypothetical protein
MLAESFHLACQLDFSLLPCRRDLPFSPSLLLGFFECGEGRHPTFLQQQNAHLKHNAAQIGIKIAQNAIIRYQYPSVRQRWVMGDLTNKLSIALTVLSTTTLKVV